MPTVSHRDLANTLERAQTAAPKGVVRSADLSRRDRELLRRTGYLNDIIKGWYFLIRPDAPEGESTIWYATYWNFLEAYLSARFGGEYCLSAIASVELHVGVTVIPRQIIAMAGRGGKALLKLPHNTSILVYQDRKAIPAETDVVNGLRVMPLPVALCRLPPSYYRSCPMNAELALRALTDTGRLIRIILDQRSPTLAARFAGAYAFLGDETRARDIETAALSVGIPVRRDNPFDRELPVLAPEIQVISPHAGRIKAMYQAMREPVLHAFKGVKRSPVRSIRSCLRRMEDVYVHDAYNSLSIEGYQVSPDLIRRIRDGKWHPERHARDGSDRDAMAAKGYREAYKVVAAAVQSVLKGRGAARTARMAYPQWYQALFSRHIKAGLLDPRRMAGHRDGPVYIRNSMHVPPRAAVVPDAMGALFDCLEREDEPIVQAVLGHFLFVFIHPYFDGNGRLARFLMNLFLVTAGYRWTVVRNDRKPEYLDALEAASTKGEITAFARFLREEMSVKWPSTSSARRS